MSNGLPYQDHAERFVDRDDDMALVLDKVRALLRGESVHKRAVFFYGPRGAGKSWLIQELARRLQEEKEFKARTIVLVIALDEHVAETPAEVVEDILCSADDHIAHARGQSLSSRGVTASKEELSNWLIEQVSDLPDEDRILTALVDNVDEASPDLLRELDTYLLSPLAGQAGTLLVLGGRTRDPHPGEGYIWNLELRLYSEEWDLEPFDETDARAQLEKLRDLYPDAPPAVLQILQEGGGYPLSNYVLAGEVVGDPPAWKDKVTALLTCANALLEIVDPDLRPFFWALCALRVFDEDRMPPLFAVHPHCSASSWSYHECRDIRERMVRTRLARWSAEHGAFVMDDAVRTVLEHALRENEPTLWRALHQAAHDFYNDLIARYPRSRERYQPEADYHAQYCTRQPRHVPEPVEEE